MSYLIDTHILLWWLFDDPKLHTDCRDIIRNPDHRIIVSSASAWEIATKYRMGKLPEAKQLVEQYSQILHQANLSNLPSPQHMRSEQEAYRSPTEIPLIA
ncbi:type II toxin-antitoxin system VapC family toxin [Nostoc commune]|nr:type II toxin-antitoxin system VapC family toxin [Nostoc commune]